MISTSNDQCNLNTPMPVIAASYLGPSLVPNQDAAWDEANLPLNPDDLVKKSWDSPCGVLAGSSNWSAVAP